MKKIFGIIVSLLLIAGSGVGVYYVVKESKVSLDISVENVEVYINETEVLSYKCNINDAEISFEVDDNTIARVTKKEDNYIVSGVAVGTTKLTMTAKYNKFKNFAEATITVKDKQEGPGTDTEIEYELYGTSNFEIDGTNITMTAGTSSIFSVVSASGDINSVDVTCADANVQVTPKPVNKSFKIDCSVAGTYELVVTVNGYNKLFNLMVEGTSLDPGAGDEDPIDDPQTDYSLNVQNGTKDDNVITITSGLNALIQIVQGADEITTYSITTENAEVSITEKGPPSPSMSYLVRSDVVGSYTISIMVNGASTAYTLVVE